MLFDLRGKRRRAVQITYAGLALLMAVGLLGAGVGSGVSGGIFDIFTGGGNGTSLSDANKPVKKKIDKANDKLKANPRDQAALIAVVRGHYTLATSDTKDDGSFGKDGKGELAKAGTAWKRYLAAEPAKVDPALATLMTTAYGSLGLNQAANASEAAEIVAEQRNDVSSYLQLVQYATLAGQKRKSDLAAAKALELAPKDQRATVKKLLKQAQATQPPAAQGGAGQAPAPAGG